MDTPLAYSIGLAKLNGRTSRKIASSTYARQLDDGRIVVDYRGTNVVTFHTDGSITLDHGGWPTNTTERRMNDVLSGPWMLMVSGSKIRAGILPRNARPWKVLTHPYWVDGVATVVPFVDVPGAVAPYSGDNFNPYTGRFGWGDNIAEITPQTCHLSAEILAAHVRPVLRYVVTVKHDNGVARIETVAADSSKARALVARAEGLNIWSSAILDVELIA